MLEKLNQICTNGVPNAKFPTDNKWGIPVLKESCQADYVDMPFIQWGSIARNRRMPGTYGFYTDDYRFNTIWKNPEKVVDSGCISAIEPNITLSLTSPRAYVIAAMFCKRWISRYWQEEGIRIFVDMNVPPEFADLNLLGVPAGWRAYATHGYAGRIDALKEEYRIACSHAGTRDILWVVYGGGKAIRELCDRKGWVNIPEQFDLQKGKYGDYLERPIFVQGRERDATEG